MKEFFKELIAEINVKPLYIAGVSLFSVYVIIKGILYVNSSG